MLTVLQLDYSRTYIEKAQNLRILGFFVLDEFWRGITDFIVIWWANLACENFTLSDKSVYQTMSFSQCPTNRFIRQYRFHSVRQISLSDNVVFTLSDKSVYRTVSVTIKFITKKHPHSKWRCPFQFYLINHHHRRHRHLMSCFLMICRRLYMCHHTSA